MRKSALAVLTIATTLLIICAGLAGAASSTVYSNLGAGNTYDLSSGYAMDGTNAAGVSFTVTGGSYTLDSILLAITYTQESFDAGLENQFIAVLQKDSGGMPSESVESWLVNGDNVVGSSIVSLISGEENILESGQTYWIAVQALPIMADISPTGSQIDSAITWNYNSTGSTASMLLAVVDSSGDTTITTTSGTATCAYAVNGTPTAATPEPSSILAVLGGLGTMGGTFLRKKK